jgi:carbamoyltransferase
MKYVLGISAYYHDSAACLFKNGQLIYACEEEKFTGIKHDSSFPIHSINYIFKRYKLSKEDIHTVCYYENPNLKMERVKKNIKNQWIKNPIYSIASLYNAFKIKRRLKGELSNYSNNVFYSEHHKSHLYYSFYTSNFQNSICLSIDGVGETDTISLGLADNKGIDYISLSEYPHSLGLFYSAMTSFLGFKPNEGEYKVMGLAPYGDENVYIDKVRQLISYKNTNLRCNMDIFCWNKSNRTMFNHKIVDLLGIQPRLPEEEILTCHKDLAAAVQKRYEEILFDILKSIAIINDNRNLCLGGGCAYNGSANGKIVRKSHFNNLWIPPAPSDAGSAIGACLHYMSENGILKDRITKNPFLGPNYFYDDYLKKKNIKYLKFSTTNSLVRNVAKLLKESKVVGWYHGHIEFGARALGNRSILADPTKPNMKDRINMLVKKRENFRPFAPMVIKDKQHIFFEVTDDVPYMNQVVKVKPDYIDELPAVTHVDGTARIQTVYKNTLMYDLLIEFEKLTGYPILLNTSMNVKDKTMALTPKDAIDTFSNTDMDYLVMGNYLIYKSL